MSTSRIALVMLLGGALFTGAAGAQAPARAPAAGDAAMAVLVAEIRALRAEMAEAARASLRSQLLVARLQLQEQRLMHLDSQRANVASRLATAERDRAAAAGVVRQFESQASDAPPGERNAAREMIENFKATLGVNESNEARLRTEESDIPNAISVEQSRWNEFSSRLDELERALTR